MEEEPAAPSATYLIRLSQTHEAFRLPELHALAELEAVPLTIASYSPTSPILLITGPPTPAAATRLVRRAILTQAVYEHWGSGATLDELHAAVQASLPRLFRPSYTTCPWKFAIDAFQGGSARAPAQRTALIDTFRYLPLSGPISLKHPALELCIFELYAPGSPLVPRAYHLARHLGPGARDLPAKYDLKARPYISTTSMAADLALLTANMALAGPGKLFYDPFVGTGSFPLAAAAFGAVCWGSDIDGRAVRGAGGEKSRAAKQRGRVGGEKTLVGNFAYYGLRGGLGDVFVGDLTHSPLRRVGFRERETRLLDGVVCDPPYGVREGLRVLGCRDPEGTPWVVEAGHARYKDPAFIPPKKPYSFDAMLADILHFASETLVDDGRLAFWMPTANDASLSASSSPSADEPSRSTSSATNSHPSSTTGSTLLKTSPPPHDAPSQPTHSAATAALPIPSHPALALVSVCIQPFSRWSRRLLTYRKLPDAAVDAAALAAWLAAQRAVLAVEGGVTADELNPFRKGYFSKFAVSPPEQEQEQEQG